MIELAILGLLKDRTMHGYEVKKELTAQLGQFWQISYGSLYPTMRRLEKAGALERVFPKEDVGRRKNIYRITDEGEEMFLRLINDYSAVDDARFSMKLAFFRYMQSDDRVEVLERRRAYLTQKLADLRSRIRSYRERIDAYTYRLMEHGVETNRAEIEWIDRLIAEEKEKTAGSPATG